MRPSSASLLLALSASRRALAEVPGGASEDSGSFGSWDVDAHGLPLYRFTCDQTRSEAIGRYARTARDSASPGESHGGPFGQNGTDSVFQIGNGRVVLLLSTYGYAQVRQDEGGPKLLNDYDPPSSQYGGGLGYLADAGTGELLLSSFYTGGGPERHLREFGVGYARRVVRGRGLVMEQRLTVPFGADGVVVSELEVVNRGAGAADLSYYEVWGGSVWQLAFGQQSRRRSFQDANYLAEVRRLAAYSGLRSRQRYRGPRCADSPPGAAEAVASLWDERLPETFLASTCEEQSPVEIGCSAGSFFGAGGAAEPRLNLSCGALPLEKQSDAAMVLRRNFSLPAGGTKRLRFVYGYVPSDDEAALDGLLSKYAGEDACSISLSESNGLAWSRELPRFAVDAHPWIGREFAWHYAMTRQSLTFDSYFGEQILDQGTVYRYDWGFQGAARDPLQHSLPFVLTDGAVVRSVIRYTLKELTDPRGGNWSSAPYNLPYYVTGHGIVGPASARPSDEELYLLYTATEYVLATRDFDFFGERVRAYNSTLDRTVLRALLDCFWYLARGIGVGQHGLLRMQTGDWNDVFVQEALNSGSSRESVVQRGESATNAAMAAAVLPRFAGALEIAAGRLGDAEALAAVPEVRRFAAGQARALRAHAWNGEWLSRAWVPVNESSAGARDFPGGWVCTNGADRRLCLEPQPWAILASSQAAPEAKGAAVLSEAEVRSVVGAIERELRAGSALGATVLNRPFRKAADPGQHENGGVWPSQNHPLVLALAATNTTAAWDEWIRNSRATQARHHPDFWPGLWSAADVTTSHLSGDGQVGVSAWPSMPVLCTHAHAWPVYSAARLAGLTFGAAGVTFRPAVPLQAGDYRFESRIADIGRRHLGEGRYVYEGRYEPAGRGDCVVALDLAGVHGHAEAGSVVARLVVTHGGVPHSEGRRDVASGVLELFDSRASGAPCGPGLEVRWRLTLDAPVLHV